MRATAAHAGAEAGAGARPELRGRGVEHDDVVLLTKKSGDTFRVGIFLDFVGRSGTARTEGPHGGASYVRGAKRNRIDPHWGGIERLATRASERQMPTWRWVQAHPGEAGDSSALRQPCSLRMLLSRASTHHTAMAAEHAAIPSDPLRHLPPRSTCTRAPGGAGPGSPGARGRAGSGPCGCWRTAS